MTSPSPAPRIKTALRGSLRPWTTFRNLLHAFFVVCLLPAVPCFGGFPEPDVVLYGHVVLDGRTNTLDDQVIIQARVVPVGGAIAQTTLGTLNSTFYSLRLPIDSAAPVSRTGASVVGDTLYLTVLRGGIVRAQVPFEIRAKGVVQRVDFGDVDTDNDGLPDGWEQAYLLDLSSGADTDPDADGLANRDEYRLGTHPLRDDAPHPADISPRDNRITITELSAYYTAWKKGNPWTLSPTNIPIEYVTRATYLWEQGEYYRIDTSDTNGAPLWWVNAPAPTPPPPGPPVPPPPAEEQAAPMVVTTLAPPVYVPGQDLILTNQVVLNTKARTFAVEHYPPAGWEVVSVQGGVYDKENGLVKWGPFLDRQGRQLSYTLRPSAEASGMQALEGLASYDGHKVTLQGARTIVALPTEPGRFMLLPAGGPDQWLLVGQPGQAYAIETSSDLKVWAPLTTTTADASGQVTFSDPQAQPTGMRFYRARQVDR